MLGMPIFVYKNAFAFSYNKKNNKSHLNIP